jgi:TolA-binding protein
MAISNYIRKRIEELEEQIQRSQGDVEFLKKELYRLKFQEFEEDLREESNRRLLQE